MIRAMNDLDALRAQADAGDALSQFRLARRLVIGAELAADHEEALRLLDRACAQGLPVALLFQATLAATGIVRPRNFLDAIGFLQAAAATGDARANGQLATLGGVAGFSASAWLTPPAGEQMFDAPRISVIRKFLAPEVCAWHAAQGAKRLMPAPVKDSTRGVSAIDKVRSNSACGFSSVEADLVLQMTRLRIASAIDLDVSHEEPSNVLHYAVGQAYGLHFDFVRADEEQVFASELRSVGQRVATVLIYLNDDYVGGETVFPRLGWAFKGQTGDALVFWNMSAAGEREMNSIHAGAPVTRGEKWLFSQWVRERPHPLL